MARPTAEYVAEATKLIEIKTSALLRLSYEQALSLPEADSTEFVIAGEKATLTTYRQTDAYQLEGKVLITVAACRQRWFGMTAHMIERGLVFSPTTPVREASQVELENSGG